MESGVAALARALTGEYECHTSHAGALKDLATDHGVDALLWQASADQSGAAALRDALEPGVRAAATRDLFVRRDLRDVTDALASNNIPALITKGTALAYTVYPQPWMRPRTDSDLLVRHADVPAACRALEACGYTRSDAVSTGELVSHQYAFERHDANGVHQVLDLHWKIVNPQVLADALSFDDLWRDSLVAAAIGPNAHVPSAIGSIAVACVHRLAHHQGNDRLIWLYDLKLLAATLTAGDWNALRDLASDRRIAGFCLDGLRSARDLLESPLPADIEDALSAAAPDEPSRAYVAGTVTKRDVLISDLKALTSWHDRIRLVREHVFPPAAFIQQRYGTTSRWLLPALYVHRFVTGASKWGRS
ncbi:MAG: nucleotidyltransferase family protein [Vicinamibacterales bacterium]